MTSQLKRTTVTVHPTTLSHVIDSRRRSACSLSYRFPSVTLLAVTPSVMRHPLDMSITTLLAVVVALYLHDTLVLGVAIEAANRDSRDEWGENRILLTCRDGDDELGNAIFTRNGVSIEAIACSPGNDGTYCTEEGGARLRFTASNVTEGYYACKNDAGNTSDELAIIGKRVLSIFANVHIVRC